MANISREKFVKISKYYREGDNALIAIQDNDNSVIIHEFTNDIDDILLEVLPKYIEKNYADFDGRQTDCIEFYRCKINKLLDDMEKELC